MEYGHDSGNVIAGGVVAADASGARAGFEHAFAVTHTIEISETAERRMHTIG